MIQVKNLTKIYGTNKVLDSINLKFEQGKIYGVLGRNGAGKTTLVNIVTNRAFATNGTIEIDGEYSYENDKAQEKVFCITEKSAYPVAEKVSSLFKWASRFYPNFDMDRAYELARRFDLETEKKLGKLSTGYTTITKVILTFASNAPYMIFDEPVLGIDAIYREVFYEELKKTHKKLNNTMIICSHILDEAESVIDDAIILKKGQVAFNGQVSKITKNQSLHDYYLELHKKDEMPKEQNNAEQKTKQKARFGKTDCKKVKHSIRYLLNITWLWAIIILGVCVLFAILPIFIKDIDFGIEMVVFINMFLIALTVHTYFFNYALYNGVSRRTYFLSLFAVLAAYAILLSLVANTYITIYHSVANKTFIIKSIYTELFTSFNLGSFISMFAWLFAVSMFLMMLSLFSVILFKALSRKGRNIAMLVLAVIGVCLALLGALAPAIPINALLFILGLNYNLGVWFASMCFTIFGAILLTASWLILRRTEIK